VKRAERVTELLQRWKVQGDGAAEDELFSIVQDELVHMARQSLERNSGFAHKLDPRELVSEAYLSLRDYQIITSNRGPFFSLMAKAMRHVLMDLARHDRAAKRPPSLLRVVDTNAMDGVTVSSDLEPIDFYRSLDSLKAISVRQATIVELRVIGLTNEEIANELSESISTIKRDIAQARAFLAIQLSLKPNWIHA
jgi:RNA polymerase sigma factor (TIGR02999 family)